MLSSFDKSFFSADVKHFIDELKLKHEKREYHTAICRKITSANTLQTLEVSFKSKLRNDSVQ